MCDCDDCKMKGYLHIPTGVIFYHMDKQALLRHTMFNTIFPDWYDTSFELLDEATMLKDPGFIQARDDWRNMGIHKVSRQCSLLKHYRTDSGDAEGTDVLYWYQEHERKCLNSLTAK